jgi:hypothetical protein
MAKKSRTGMSRFWLGEAEDRGRAAAVFVWSRTFEAAAKKLYRTRKGAATITVTDGTGTRTFDVAAWCRGPSRKLPSKPKAHSLP